MHYYSGCDVTLTFIDLLELLDDVFVLCVSTTALCVSHTLQAVALASVHGLLLTPEVGACIEVRQTVRNQLVDTGTPLRLALRF